MNFIDEDEDDLPLDPLFAPLYSHILEKMKGASNREIWAAIRKHDEEYLKKREAEKSARAVDEDGDSDDRDSEEEDKHNSDAETSNHVKILSESPKQTGSGVSLTESQFIKGLTQPRSASTPYAKKSSTKLLTKSRLRQKKITKIDLNVEDERASEPEVAPKACSRKIYKRKAKTQNVVETQNQKTEKKKNPKFTKPKKVPENVVKSKKINQKKNSTESKSNKPSEKKTNVKKKTQNIKEKIEKKKPILKQKQTSNSKSKLNDENCNKQKKVERNTHVKATARKGTLKYHQQVRELHQQMNKNKEDGDLFDQIGSESADFDLPTIPELPDDTSSSTINTIRSLRSFGVSESSKSGFIKYLGSDDSMKVPQTNQDTSMRNRASKISEEMLKAHRSWRKRPSKTIPDKKVVKKKIHLTKKMLEFEEDDFEDESSEED